MKLYLSLRGRTSITRPIREISISEREQILKEKLQGPTSLVRKRHNISTRTLGHIVYHHKDILRKIEDENFKKHGL